MAAPEGGYQLAETLFATFTVTEAQQRRQAEERLRLFAATPKAYSLALLGLIISEDPAFTTDLKKSAAHQLKKTLSTACNDGVFTVQDKIDFAQEIMRVMTLGTLAKGVVEALGICLNPVLDANRHDAEGKACAEVQKVVCSALANSDSGSCVRLLKVVKMMFTSVSRLKHGIEFYEELNPLLIAIGRRLASVYRRDIEESEALMEWADTMNGIVQFFDVNESSYLKTISSDFQLADTMTQVVLASSECGPKRGLIWVDASPLADSSNNCKSEILSIFSTILLFLSDNKKRMNEESGNFSKLISVVGISVAPCPFVNAALQLSEELICSVLQVCAMPALQEALMISSVKRIVKQALNFLHKCIRETPFYSIFASTYKALIVGACLPLLQCSPLEFDLIDSDPEEFHSLAMDICERQDIENLKTSAAQLFEAIADNIDGALSFTTYYLGQIVEYTLERSRGYEQFSALVEMSGYSRLMESREDLRIEVALLSFCVLGYTIQKRSDLKTALHNLLEEHFHTLASATSAIVHARLCLVVYFLFDTMCITSGMLEATIMYLLRVLGANATPKVVHLPACTALLQILTDYEDDERLDKYIPVIISTMVAILPYQTNKDFFESLQRVLITNVSLVTNGLTPLLTGLVHKIRTETAEAARISDRRKTQSLIVVKCWNIIRAVLDSTHVSPDLMCMAESLLAPLFDCICEPEKIDFEDDIVVAGASIVKKNKAVTTLCWQIYERLPLVQQKYRGELRHIFSFLNVVIAFGSSCIVANPKYLQQLLDMCKQSLNAHHAGKVNEVATSQGAVLLQQLLLTCSGQVDGAVRDIMESAMRRYAGGCAQDFLKIRLLDTVLAAVNYSPALAIANLQAMSASGLSELLRELLSLQDCFYHSYDKKLAIICLSHLFCLDPMPTDVAVVLPALLEATVRILTASKLPAPPQQSHAIDYLTDLFPEDGEEDDELPLETESQTRSEEAEAALLITSMLSPLQEFDETEMLRTALNCLYQRSQRSVEEVLGTLPTERRKALADLLQSRRIPIRSIATDSTVLRKIVKARRRLQK